MSAAEQYPSEQTDLLFETVKWWILMLSSVSRRMATYLDRQQSIESILSHEGARPITVYFTEAEIDEMVMEREHPDVVRLRLQADAFFVASALYQINSLLSRLSSQSVWRDNLASVGNKFRQIYRENKLHDLRNFIEHADEHIASTKQDIAKDFEEGFGVKLWGATKRFSGGVETFFVFGTEFQVIYAVEAAQQVLAHIPNVTETDRAIASQ